MTEKYFLLPAQSYPLTPAQTALQHLSEKLPDFEIQPVNTIRPPEAEYMPCICKTACFPVNYKEPMPRRSLQLWKECGQRSCKALNGYRSLNVVNGLG